MPSEEKLEKRAKNILLHQLTRSAKTEHQLREVLVKREIPRELIDSAIADFVAAGLIDDLAFAKGFLSSRLAKGKAVRLIGRELRSKGVPDSIIETVCSEITIEDQREQVMQLAKKRAVRLAGLDAEVRRRRLSGYLLRRGFPAALVSQAVRVVERQG
jgi:regulatory protein